MSKNYKSKKRVKLSSKVSKKMFTKTARKVNSRNSLNPMRGGIRL